MEELYYPRGIGPTQKIEYIKSSGYDAFILFPFLILFDLYNVVKKFAGVGEQVDPPVLETGCESSESSSLFACTKFLADSLKFHNGTMENAAP